MGQRRVPVGVALKGFSSLSLCQIQTLMARAEYLKDQMKVGLLTGGLWSMLGQEGLQAGK